MDCDSFIEWVGPVAQKICKKYGLFASVCIAQSAIESGWGNFIIGDFNMFGRKAVDGDDYQEFITPEFIDGQWTIIIDKFKTYFSLEEAIEDYCILITQEPVYAPVLEHLDDIEAYTKTLGVIYATDPDYASKVLSTIHAADLVNYDEE